MSASLIDHESYKQLVDEGVRWKKEMQKKVMAMSGNVHSEASAKKLLEVGVTLTIVRGD